MDSIAQPIPRYLPKPLLRLRQKKKKACLNHHSQEFGQKATTKAIILGSEIAIKNNNKTSSKSDAANKPIEKISTKKKYLKDNIFHPVPGTLEVLMQRNNPCV